jgi:hypothetical protein
VSGESRRAIRPTAAIIIGALVVSASILFAASSNGLGGVRTVTKVETATVSSMQLHRVTFNETGGCVSPPSPYYYERWYVTMNNITLVQPSNVTLSQINNQTTGREGQVYKLISTIVFTVPDGSYPYYASIGGGQGGGSQGIVSVDGSDKVVQIFTGPFCP